MADIQRPKYFNPYEAAGYGLIDRVLEPKEESMVCTCGHFCACGLLSLILCAGACMHVCMLEEVRYLAKHTTTVVGFLSYSYTGKQMGSVCHHMLAHLLPELLPGVQGLGRDED